MKIAKIITGVAIVLVVALVVGLVFKFTNGFNEDFKTFYLERDGKGILTSKTDTSFKRGEQYRYDVKYTFDKEDAEPRGYSVKVVPNGELKFSFKADGKQYLYADAKELTSAFSIKKEATAFTLTIPENQSLKAVLEKVYGKAVEVEEPEGNLYTLVVSSYNEKVTYSINFAVVTPVKGIELNAGSIIFGGKGSISGGTINPPSISPTEPSQSEGKKYGIEYDTLGSGSVLSVRFDCVSKAAEGAKVTFTVSLVDLSDEFDDYQPLEIVAIRLRPRDYDCDDIEIGSGEGTFSFVMPASFVTVMIYLMPE